MCVSVTKVGQSHPKLFWSNAPLDLPVCQIRSLYLTSRRCKSSRNVANLRGLSKLGAIFARLYLENGTSHENCGTGARHTLGPSAIRCNAQICCKPKGYGGSAETGSAPRSWFRKFSYRCMSISKSRLTSSEVTVGVTTLSHLPSCQIWSLSVTSRRRRANWNVATCRELHQIKDDFLYLAV